MQAVQLTTWQGSDAGSQVSNMPQTRASLSQLGPLTAALRDNKPAMSWEGHSDIHVNSTHQESVVVSVASLMIGLPHSTLHARCMIMGTVC